MIKVGDKYMLASSAKEHFQILTSTPHSGAVVEILDLPLFEGDGLYRIICVKTGQMCSMREHVFIRKKW